MTQAEVKQWCELTRKLLCAHEEEIKDLPDVVSIRKAQRGMTRRLEILVAILEGRKDGTGSLSQTVDAESPPTQTA